MPLGTFCAARHFDVPDGADANFLTLRGQENFAPQGIICNSSSDAAEQAAGYAFVRGFLIGENAQKTALYRINIGEKVDLAFAQIYANGTTARGLKILSEV